MLRVKSALSLLECVAGALLVRIIVSASLSQCPLFECRVSGEVE